MTPLADVLRNALIDAERQLAAEATRRLADVRQLSENEQAVLAGLGAREDWYPKLVQIGRSALRLAEDLKAEDWEASYVIQDAVDPGRPYFGIPELGIEFAAAHAFIDSLHSRVSRVQELVWSVIHADLSPRAAAYLQRLGRCYVAGFDAEVVILCRAALDTALRDVLGDGASGPHSMYARIGLAAEHGLLNSAAIESAHQIRLRGNHAVHEEPTRHDIASDTLDKTMQVLSQLLGNG